MPKLSEGLFYLKDMVNRHPVRVIMDSSLCPVEIC